MEALGQIRSVTPVIAGARGDFELSLELREFYHDLSSTPGQARIVIAADLLETAHRTVVASRIVDVSTPVQEFDSAGAVAALSAGAGKALTELSEWVAASCAASLPSGAGQQVTD